ncbi:hypothetical protein Glove_303g120 [Diversispora epigaea]|uniref:Uncharacterized protein n=1 Tax=Diversispora epigaea TaxID=1348612 RepID=A0A397HY91_9GLOM|nr:hypothetical protein Glove_303g120 [Diversispora epigaea]
MVWSKKQNVCHSTDIEILREELVLTSSEYDVLSRSYNKGKASQQSNVTIANNDDDVKFIQELGLIAEKDSSSVSVEITKQVNMEDRETSPTAKENISDTQNDRVSTAEKGTTNVVQVIHVVKTIELNQTQLKLRKIGVESRQILIFTMQVNSTDQDNANETTDSTTSTLKRSNPLASDNLQSTKKVKKSDEKKNSNVVKKLIDELSIETSQISEVNEESTAQALVNKEVGKQLPEWLVKLRCEKEKRELRRYTNYLVKLG